jgi:uncharacterized protein (DUF169 family)
LVALEMRQVAEPWRRLIEAVWLTASPVGVRLLGHNDSVPVGAERLQGYRYCQALMRARRGESVLLDGEGISCPAAAAAFGFRPLPEGLRSGKGLVGYGIVAAPSVGARMFEGMARIEPGQVALLHLFPLEGAEHLPDVVVIEDEVEKLMWLALAQANVLGGERVASSTAALQATCVDATVIRYREGRLNLSYGCYGCYGCRDATELTGGEAVMGFPGEMLEPLVLQLEHPRAKAIPSSRGKGALAALRAQASV